MKKLMAKKTAEKQIKELIENNKVYAFKFGKERVYSLSDDELSEKQLEDKISFITKKLHKEIDSIEKNFPNYDLYTKRNIPDFLGQVLSNISKTKENILRLSRMENITDMTTAYEHRRDIKKALSKSKMNSEEKYEILDKAHENISNIETAQKQYFEMMEKTRSMSASVKRNKIRDEMKLLYSKIGKFYDELEKIKKDLKI